MLWAVAPALVVVAASVVGARAVGADLGDLVREATTVGDLPFYAGGLSAVTVSLWSAAAAVALAAAADRPWRDRRLGELVLVLGALSLSLALDDQFRLHDDVLIRVGVPEKAVIVGYAVVAGLALWRGREVLRRRVDTAVLGIAALLLSASVAVDGLQRTLERGGLDAELRVFLEDSCKLVGAAVWLYWLILVARGVGRGPGPAGSAGPVTGRT